MYADLVKKQSILLSLIKIPKARIFVLLLGEGRGVVRYFVREG